MSINTRDTLIEALQQDGDEFERAVRRLPLDSFEEGVYEHGWNGRQLLAHIAAIEWTYPKLIERAESASQASAGDDSFDMNAYNAKQVERRADQPVEQLLTEFKRNRAATIDTVRAVDDALLGQPTRSAGGVEGNLLQVLASVSIDHVREHVGDLLRGGSADD